MRSNGPCLPSARPRLAVAGSGGLVPLAAQVLLQAQDDVRFIFDDQDSCHDQLPRGSRIAELRCPVLPRSSSSIFPRWADDDVADHGQAEARALDPEAARLLAAHELAEDRLLLGRRESRIPRRAPKSPRPASCARL